MDNLGRAIALEGYYNFDTEDRTKFGIQQTSRRMWIRNARDGAYMVCKERPDEVKSTIWQEWLWCLDIELASIW